MLPREHLAKTSSTLSILTGGGVVGATHPRS
jgi:hypothetical protein